MADATPARWLLLVHQLPRTPAYLRARVGRQRARIGAVPVKNSVYVLPSTDDSREDFQWVAREVRGAGADASVFGASVVDGLTDAEIETRSLSHAAVERGGRTPSIAPDRAGR